MTRPGQAHRVVESFENAERPLADRISRPARWSKSHDCQRLSAVLLVGCAGSRISGAGSRTTGFQRISSACATSQVSGCLARPHRERRSSSSHALG